MFGEQTVTWENFGKFALDVLVLPVANGSYVSEGSAVKQSRCTFYFTHSTASNADVIQKHSHRHTKK